MPKPPVGQPDDSEGVSPELATLLKQQLTLTGQILYRKLAGRGRLAEYERMIGIDRADVAFRKAVVLALARYITGSWMEATTPPPPMRRPRGRPQLEFARQSTLELAAAFEKVTGRPATIDNRTDDGCGPFRDLLDLFQADYDRYVLHFVPDDAPTFASDRLWRLYREARNGLTR